MRPSWARSLRCAVDPLRDNLTERRNELTHRKPVLSKLRSPLSKKNAQSAPPRKVIAFAANSRFVGFALIVHGEVALLQAHRLRERANVGDWVKRLVRTHRPDLVVLAEDDEHRPEVAGRVANALFDAATAVTDAVVHVDRDHVARALGLTRSDAKTLGRELGQRHPYVATAAPVGRGPRTDRERHREMSVLAAAAGLAAVAMLCA